MREEATTWKTSKVRRDRKRRSATLNWRWYQCCWGPLSGCHQPNGRLKRPEWAGSRGRFDDFKHRPTSRRRPGNGFGDLVPGIGSARGEWFGPSLLYGRGPHRLLLYLGLDWHCAGGRDPIKGAASGALD